jgi:hypothetical protein
MLDERRTKDRRYDENGMKFGRRRRRSQSRKTRVFCCGTQIFLIISS